MSDVLFLQNYNTRLVVLSVSLLGVACGVIGTFLILRKRALVSDALSHACLPGIALAFMFLYFLEADSRALLPLLLGATATGLLGFVVMLLIRRYTRLGDDAAMGIVLSVFYGAGVALLGIIQGLPGASAAGLKAFIYGKTASMVMADFWLILAASVVCLLVVSLLFKELRLLCFDEAYAAARGYAVRWLDITLLSIATLMTVAGLKAVGLILIIAFLIIPAAAATYWTSRLFPRILCAGAMGGAAGWMGSISSAMAPNLPAGALIVLAAALIFLVSFSRSLMTS